MKISLTKFYMRMLATKKIFQMANKKKICKIKNLNNEEDKMKKINENNTKINNNEFIYLI